MKRMSAICAAAALLSGCATIDSLDCVRHAPVEGGMTPVENVQVMNTNWKLLSCIPLASGDPAQPNTVACRMFRNTVTLQNQLDMLEAEARRTGAKKAVDVTTEYSNERVLFFLLLREKILTSATLVK
ncbi:MAG: hypothetical protein IJQ65_04715 [Kiritimatiellae bacterium]|nr:hypothetical protein [Kiritimatiellia bacterium]